MRRGNEITVKIEKTEFPSVGISSFDGKKIYVKNAFPGETVKGRVKKKKADYADLKLIEVVEKAPYEIEAKCPHFGICGGCSSQHLSYDKQLELLSDEVLELFKNAEVTTGEYEGVVGSVDQFEYRNKMEFTFGDEYKGGELCLGMHMRNQSFGIITVNECKLVDEDFRKVINATVEYFRGKDLPYYRVMKREGYLRHLVIRKAKNTGELLVNLVTTTQVDFDLTEWTNIIKGLDFQGELVSILHTENNSFSDAVIPEKVNVLFGKDYIMEELLGLKFKISPFSFFQTNTKGAEELYSIVREFMGNSDNKVVFDLYCGTGTIGQIVAPKAKKVIGLELIEEAVEAAKENAKLNGLDNCTFIAGDVAETIKEVKDKPDIIILDPPRSGVSPKALEYVIKFDAKEIVYVSCNPKTLVDNLKDLMTHGYKIERTRVKDMFPNTPHGEVVVKLIKK
ncbi:23S rRNA (uracil(1939)-C(5))-methyltransferase RlmD [Clostridium baratii]|uniref:23S rRNA (uracil(1939)-C(5))-methyltransferase RlmD n=1 Tax=Clostridium baratii TaxID=1561 RepID=UPI00097FAD1F|nr:23S rRNA (uracil(1939)-C(5))-methyltransferase RlmD [Clostridium baratii]AQM61246.1 23S rRNA (uracil(1939)-C(5))-methyltransferase RlmD [Clostridium baratii]